MTSQQTIDEFLAGGMKRPSEDSDSDLPSSKKLAMDDSFHSDHMSSPKDNRNKDMGEFDAMFDKLSSHMDTLTAKMEKRLSAQIAATVASVIAKELEVAMQSVRDEFNAELKVIKDRIGKLESAPKPDKATYSNVMTDKMDTVLYVSGLPTSDHENIQNKVKTVLRDGCKVKDFKLSSVERRKGFNGRPGVVVVKECELHCL